MKRSLPLFLALCLLLALAGCGYSPSDFAERPSRTEAPQQTETPFITEPPQTERGDEPTVDASGFPLLLHNRESASADLDGDGTEENIRVNIVPATGSSDAQVQLFRNGYDYQSSLNALGVSIVNPEESWWAITDIDESDGLLEIAIQDQGPSDDYCTHFFRFLNGDHLSYLGAVEGMIRTSWGDGSIRFDGHGRIHSYIRLQVLQTWYAYADYVETESGLSYTFREEDYVAEMPELSAFTVTHPSHVRLLKDLMAYEWQYGYWAGQGIVIPAGTEVDLIACDNSCWIEARCDDENWVLWFMLSLDNPYQILGADGPVDVWDALDGLNFAD